MFGVRVEHREVTGFSKCLKKSRSLGTINTDIKRNNVFWKPWKRYVSLKRSVTNCAIHTADIHLGISFCKQLGCDV